MGQTEVLWGQEMSAISHVKLEDSLWFLLDTMRSLGLIKKNPYNSLKLEPYYQLRNRLEYYYYEKHK